MKLVVYASLSVAEMSLLKIKEKRDNWGLLGIFGMW